MMLPSGSSYVFSLSSPNQSSRLRCYNRQADWFRQSTPARHRRCKHHELVHQKEWSCNGKCKTQMPTAAATAKCGASAPHCPALQVHHGDKDANMAS
eukprot:CAMPEP_0185904190 /NCGR_PEP_ID=MMETSP0196C-20130402/3512_1 /TAXON_ID=2932 /ORGANISM="Alexandrium fundyense, Strain CCMP1719" /LENGTH=96 /DNA_ID=CAMNT_0028623451 /DNA_START=1 /DNA_END=287 /DNA_ORIENTATION=+